METGKNGNICLQIEFLCFFLQLSISIITVEMMINDNTGIFHLFELRIGMNEFDHRSFLSLLKQQRERPEKFRPQRIFEPWPLRCRCSAPPVQLSGQLVNDDCLYFKLLWLLNSNIRDIWEGYNKFMVLMLPGTDIYTSYLIAHCTVHSCATSSRSTPCATVMNINNRNQHNVNCRCFFRWMHVCNCFVCKKLNWNGGCVFWEKKTRC